MVVEERWWKSAPAAVIAGAGASVHQGLPTGEDLSREIEREVSRLAPAAVGLWRYLAAPVVSRWGGAEFEAMYELVDAACRGTLVDGSPDGDPVPEQTPLPPGVEDVARAALTLRNTMVRVLTQRCGAIPAAPSGVCWRDFLQLVHPGPGTILPVFTTNYDNLLEVIDLPGYSVKYGSKTSNAAYAALEGDVLAVEELTNAQCPSDEKWVLVLHLHGCVHWVRNPASRRIVLTRAATSTPADARAAVWPSRHKLPFEEPFWTAHMLLLECALSVDDIYFIGYGFRDTAVSALLRHATMAREEEPTVSILDPDPTAAARGCETAFGALRKVQGVTHKFDSQLWDALPKEPPDRLRDDPHTCIRALALASQWDQHLPRAQPLRLAGSSRDKGVWFEMGTRHVHTKGCGKMSFFVLDETPERPGAFNIRVQVTVSYRQPEAKTGFAFGLTEEGDYYGVSVAGEGMVSIGRFTHSGQICINEVPLLANCSARSFVLLIDYDAAREPDQIFVAMLDAEGELLACRRLKSYRRHTGRLAFYASGRVRSSFSVYQSSW